MVDYSFKDPWMSNRPRETKRSRNRLAAHSSVTSERLQASRGPLSLLAGNRAKAPGALGYTGRPCLEGIPGRPRAELGVS